MMLGFWQPTSNTARSATKSSFFRVIAAPLMYHLQLLGSFYADARRDVSERPSLVSAPLPAFSLRTALPIDEPPDADEREERIRELSREKYARPRQEVEEEISACYRSPFPSVDEEDYHEEFQATPL